MSESKKPTTLNEIMGKQGGDLTLDNLPDILGEKMPELPRNSLGRYRLTKALRNRFGEGYRNLPGIKILLQEFDKEVNLKRLVAANRRSK